MEQETTVSGNKGFISLGLQQSLVDALTRLGYEEPTPIQEQAIPPVLAGRDLLGQAATGTGKTAAFALPMIQRLVQAGRNRPMPSALILVPTRELAIQVAEAIHKYGRELQVSVVPIYGGQAYGQQIRVLERGVDIVVATPGRALDHIGRGTLKLGGVNTVVLDEADEMLDMGFVDDIETILQSVPKERQVMLFSATLPPRIASIVKRHQRNPVEVKIAAERLSADALPRVQQTTYIVNRSQKPESLGRVLDMENPASAIIFCRTRNEVDELSENLRARGYQPETLHGGMAQAHRDRVIKRLRSGLVDLVLATDVASRGLDIEHLTHVINYDVPASPETYVHRIGRVGRAGREGIAITLAEARDHRQLRNIEQLTRQKMKIAKVPTIDDLRARRMEKMHASVRDMILGEDLDQFRVIVEQLSGEFDIVEVALASLKLAHQAMGVKEPEDELPSMDTIKPIIPFNRPSADKGPSPRPAARAPLEKASPRAAAPAGKPKRREERKAPYAKAPAAKPTKKAPKKKTRT